MTDENQDISKLVEEVVKLSKALETVSAEINKPETNGRVKIIDVIIRVTVPILLAAGAWVFNSVIDLDKRVIAIESNRYTSTNARQNAQKDATEKRELWKAITDFKEKLPPDLLLERIRKLEAKIDKK